MRIETGFVTDRGLNPDRPVNEDAFRVSEPTPDSAEAARGMLYVVADGVGGAVAGEHASRRAVEAIESAYYGAGWNGAAAGALAIAVQAANRAVFDDAAFSPGLRGMATTVTALVLLDGHAYVAQVGDSRCYLLRDGQLRQITRDHSLVAERVRDGLITEEEARVSSERNVITRWLGTEPSVAVDSYDFAVGPGDVALLCTDGLHGEVDDQEIQRALHSGAPQAALDGLVALVKSRGAPDNVTAIAVAIDRQPARPAPRFGPVVPARRKPSPIVPVVAAAVGLALAVSVVVLLTVGRRGARTEHKPEVEDTSSGKVPAQLVGFKDSLSAACTEATNIQNDHTGDMEIHRCYILIRNIYDRHYMSDSIPTEVVKEMQEALISIRGLAEGRQTE